MSYLTQKTVKNNVPFNGVALHSGVNVNINIKPASPNFGIVFKRIDLKKNNLVYPNFANVTNTSLNTIPKLGSAGFIRIFTKWPLCKATPLNDTFSLIVFWVK